MHVIILAVLFVFGLIVGSFLNVVIYRTIHGESPAQGRSKCDDCGVLISWYDNIPLLSFLMLKGKCRHCQKKISWTYPAVELSTGLMFVWWYGIGFAFFKLSQAPLTLVQPLFWLIVGILLLIIFVTDWLYQVIPDYANYGLGILVLVYRLYLAISGAMQWQDFWLAVATGIGLMLFIGSLWFFTKGRGMGFGDVKYALVMGLLLGWPRGLVGMFLAFLVGAVVGVLLILFKYKKMKEKIAFGPFLVLGTVLALIWGGGIWGWYMGILI